MANVNLNTVWHGNTKGNGTIQGNGFETNIAIPESLGGSGEGAEPKGLLVSSAASCYSMTLVAMLETRKLNVTGLTMNSEATNSKEEGFKITHYPNIVLSADATEEQIESANRAIVAADKGCAVGNTLKKADVQINIEGKVSVGYGEGII
ncbi:OsmC family protein [Metabacillus herbersteinensis]|uniref:OsmC family protein n=1 Tax=Metabacillus herbersteinensis TaxID=283816 RepID=A0ABV6GI80_9BACI